MTITSINPRDWIQHTKHQLHSIPELLGRDKGLTAALHTCPTGAEGAQSAADGLWSRLVGGQPSKRSLGIDVAYSAIHDAAS